MTAMTKRIGRRSWLGRMGAGVLGAGILGSGLAACVRGTPRSGEDADADPYRYVLSDGIPDHETGMFPNMGCPFPVLEQNIRYRMLRRPDPAATLTPIGYWVMGIA